MTTKVVDRSKFNRVWLAKSPGSSLCASLLNTTEHSTKTGTFDLSEKLVKPITSIQTHFNVIFVKCKDIKKPKERHKNHVCLEVIAHQTQKARWFHPHDTSKTDRTFCMYNICFAMADLYGCLLEFAWRRATKLAVSCLQPVSSRVVCLAKGANS